MADRKLFPFLNEIRAPMREELLRRRDALTEVVAPFARMTSMKEKGTGPGTSYRYFHLGLQGTDDALERAQNIFDLSYGDEDVVGYAYTTSTPATRIPISLEDQGFTDVADGKHPVPGIVRISVEHKGANSPVYFEVRWVCYNISQLDFLRQHFMTAGSFIAIEYGQYYASADGREIADLNNKISEAQYEWPEKKHTQLALDFLWGRANIVRNYAAKCGGNYDIWVGQIVDFEMTMRDDGAYECMTRAYSTGEAMFSIASHTPLYSYQNPNSELEERGVPYTVLINEYFKPFGKMERLIRQLSQEQEKEDAPILVVNTTALDLVEKLTSTDQRKKAAKEVPEVAALINEAKSAVAFGAVGRELEITKSLLYFGDAQWFIRFQTFIDTMIPDLLRWMDEGSIYIQYREGYDNINRPTKAELSPNRLYTADKRKAKLDRANREQERQNLQDQTPLVESLNIRPISEVRESLPPISETLSAERAPSILDSNTDDSAQTDISSLYSEWGPTDIVGNNKYLVSTDPTTLLIRFDESELHLDDADASLTGRALVVDLSEDERSGGDLSTSDERVGGASSDLAESLRCNLDKTADKFGRSDAELTGPTTAGTTIPNVGYLSEGVWLNVNAIQEAFLSSQTLYQAFVNLLGRMNAATGHFWKLEFVYDEEINQFNIIDMGLATLESKNEVQSKSYTFNYGTKSEVMSLEFNAKMSKEVKTLVMLTADDSKQPAYGAGLYGLILNRQPLTDLFAQTMNAVNPAYRDLRQIPASLGGETSDERQDRIRRAKSTEEESLSAQGESVGQVYREQFFEKFNNAIRKYIGVPGYMIPLIGYDAAEELRKTGSSHNSYLAPVPTEITLNMAIRGIAGLAFHDVFTVDKLPTIYREYGVFLINGLNHEISSEGWITNVSGIYYFMWPKESDLPDQGSAQ